jgi:hypothetical protein
MVSSAPPAARAWNDAVFRSRLFRHLDSATLLAAMRTSTTGLLHGAEVIYEFMNCDDLDEVLYAVKNTVSCCEHAAASWTRGEAGSQRLHDGMRSRALDIVLTVCRCGISSTAPAYERSPITT